MNMRLSLRHRPLALLGLIAALLPFTVLAQAPTILSDPANISVTSGQAATFSVSASGAQPLTYQWRRNGFAIAGATSPTLTLANTTRLDADYYDVVVTSGLASTTSQNARLSVAPTSYPTVVIPDPAWNTTQIELQNGQGLVMVPLADGRAYVAGAFMSIAGVAQTGIARIRADGTLDPTFVPPVFDDRISAVAVQSDGRVVVGGPFLHIDGLPRKRLARLNPDGSLDSAFNATANSSVSALAVQHDDRILVGSTGGNFLVRLGTNGAADNTFQSQGFNGVVTAIVLQPDGRILAGGGFTTYFDASGSAIPRNRIARLNASGTLDSSFTPPPTTTQVNALALKPDGQLIVGGGILAGVMRLNANGSNDASFAIGAGVSGGPVSAVAVQSDGRILVGGGFTSLNGTAANRFVRLNTDGSRDTTLLTLGFTSTVNSLAVQATGQILVGGLFSAWMSPSGGQTGRSRFARLNTNGTLDTGYNFSGIRMWGTVNALLPVAGGKMIVTGVFHNAGGTSASFGIARFNADGTVDPTFSAGSGANSNINGAAVQPDGKIVITGSFTTYNGASINGIARLNPDGTLDPTFNPGSGLAGGNVVAILPGGRVFVAGTFSSVNGVSRSRVAVLTSSGALDPTFAPGGGGNSSVFACAVQPDGRIIIGGIFTSYNGAPAARIARLNTNGTLDPTFAVSPGANADVNSLALQPDGRIFAGGAFASFHGASRSGVVRLNANGTLDSTFVPAPASPVFAVLPQEDGKVLLRGTFTSVGGAANTAYLARLNVDGSRDLTFASAGFLEASVRPNMLALRDDGRLFMQSNGVPSISATQPASAPVFATQPSSLVRFIGGSASFAATTASPLPVSYQWLFNNTPIAGQTSATLALTNVQLASAGSYQLIATSELGATASAVATLTVNKLPATVSLSGLASIYGGTPRVVEVNTEPAGLAVTVTYDGSSTPPTNAGSYAVVARIDDAIYAGSVSGTLTIAKATATVVFGASAPTYDGSAKRASVATLPANLPVLLTYNGAATEPVDAGTYAVVGTIDDPNYEGSASATFAIAKATATLAFAGLNPTYDGASKLVTVLTTPAGLPVVVSYNGQAMAPTNAGSYLVQASVNHANYTGTGSATLIIAPAAASISLSNLFQFYDGDPRAVTVTTVPATINLSVTYDGETAAPIAPGSYSVVATSADPNYSASATARFVVGTTVLVQHAPAISGGVDGSIQVALAENLTLGGNAWVSGDLLLPGLPTVQTNGTPTFVGVRDLTGAADPANYVAALTGTAALRYVVRRVDPVAPPLVDAPPLPTGRRDIVIANERQIPGDWTVLRDVRIAGNLGDVSVPAGTLGELSVTGASNVVLGTVGAMEPAIYNLQRLALNGNAQLKVVGPVVLTVAEDVSLTSDAGNAAHPEWLLLRVATGGVSVHGNARVSAQLVAPSGTVTIGAGTLTGSVAAESLVIGGDGLVEQPAP